MIKFKAEIVMFEAKIKPKYARTLYTVVDAAQREIKKTQKIHNSYNKPAEIIIYEKDDNGIWINLDKRKVESLHIS
ncbi:hypothetical protein [Paenibacillus sp. FSL H7-0331]|uniref:hypothetical protein n=1 Tax=Paenibacillus sp. FSL H7-0331 TaxID=1920421 RepID=UPI00096C3DE6|nr:hypothetical protein [Paenibacillus sp. FSL H7-0331]OME97382.1 hypothetical protein BK127_40585 [Paenibacillus sp. FSL H7-0331]